MCVCEPTAELTNLSLRGFREESGLSAELQAKPRVQGVGSGGVRAGGRERSVGGGCINSSTSQSGGCLPDRDLRLRFWADRHIP